MVQVQPRENGNEQGTIRAQKGTHQSAQTVWVIKWEIHKGMREEGAGEGRESVEGGKLWESAEESEEVHKWHKEQLCTNLLDN